MSLRSTVAEQSDQISHLQSDINDSEQYSRLPNLEIHGYPVRPNENLQVLINELATKLNLAAFQPSEVLTLHRLPAKRDAIPPIIVRFQSVRSKEKWMEAKKNLRLLSQSDPGLRLFFNDNLTHANKELFWKARCCGRERNYKFVWVRNSKMFAKKSEGSPLVRVNSVRDLEKIV